MFWQQFLRLFSVAILTIANANVSLGQSIGDYRSAASGLWNEPSSWERFNGIGWVISGVPSSSDGAITLRAGHTITVPETLTIQTDQTTVASGATLRVFGTLTIADGPGVDLRVYFAAGPDGLLDVFGRVELLQGATAQEYGSGSKPISSQTTIFRTGSVYAHRYSTSPGILFGAVWEDGSTVEISGYTSNSGKPQNLNQNFFNVRWVCPSQTNLIPLQGDLQTVRGDLEFLSTGTGKVKIFTSSSDKTLTIGNNFRVAGTSSILLSEMGTGNLVAIGGSFINTSSGQLTFATSGTCLLTVAGNFEHHSGEIRFSSSQQGISTMYLTGDLVLDGDISASSNTSGRGIIHFVGGRLHKYSGGGNAVRVFDYIVADGDSLDLGTSALKGQGTFTLGAGCTLFLQSTNGNGTNLNGSLQNNMSAGQIRVPANKRFYGPESVIVYNGTSPQQIGNGHPNNLRVIINNPTSVTLAANITASDLTLNAGTLDNGIYSITITRNWIAAGGTFSPGSGPVVFNGTTAITGPGAKNFGHLIVQSQATLSLPNVDIPLTGNLSIADNATIEQNQGRFTFVGTQPQSISVNGQILNNIMINKSAGSVTFTSPLVLANLLEVQSSTELYSNGNLVLMSSGDKPTVDGAIGPLPAGAAVVGNVVVQRYMGAIGKAWRFISSPVQNTLLADLKDDFKVATNSLRWYDPTMVNTPENERFRTVPPKSATYTLEVGRGYTAYMWDNKAVNLDFTGPINFGPIDLPVVRGVSNPVNPWGDGWNLVGNPYPSAIAWNGGAGWDMQNIATTVGVEVSGAGGVWNYYNFADGSGDLTDGIIATGQGFWVYAYDENPSLQINEQAKTAAKGGSFYRGKPSEQSRQLIVAISGEAGIRKAFFKLNSQATEDFDPLFDAYPIPAAALEDFGISLLDLNGSELLMHTIDELAPEREIPLQVTLPQAGHYTITFPENAAFPLAPKLFLYDKVTGAITSVSDGGSYGFEAEQGGTIRNRFLLTMTPGQEQTPAELVAAYPNPFESRFTIEVASPDPAVAEILDMRGQRLSTHTFTQRLEVDAGAYVPGVYVARVKTTQGVVIRKLLKR